MVFNNIDEFNENKPDEEKWLKIKFNPWYFSNRDTILIHFFDTLKESYHNPQVKVEIFKYLSQFKDKICQDISFTLENENFKPVIFFYNPNIRSHGSPDYQEFL